MPADDTSEAPPVSVVVPARNAADTIAAAVRSVLAQDYAGPVELIVADGSDGPATAEQVRAVAPNACIVPNLMRTTSEGLNAALSVATARIIVRCDAHASLPPDYVRTAVATLGRTGAANVGGRQVPVGTSWFTCALALALTTWLGNGGARHRQGGVEGPVDTVYLGAFRREALAKIGDFNAACGTNEDYELNWRLRQQGEVVWFEPGLQASYRPRRNLRALARQYYEYGKGKWEMLRRHPSSVRLRQVAAPTLVLGLAGSLVLAAAGATTAAVVVPAAWLGTLACGAAVVGVRRRDRTALLLPLALATMHLSWGLGFLLAAALPSRRPGGTP